MAHSSYAVPMLLEISTTHSPATDLGYLLHKNPARLQSFEMSFGQAHVFYSQANPSRCTANLLLEVDPVALVRGQGQSDGWLEQYVNDRPYVASSFLSVALARVLRDALAGRSKERPELAKTAIALEARVTVLPSRSGEVFLRQLFEPLGYTVTTTSHVLDSRFPQWGDSHYFTVTLSAVTTLSSLLCHLYVLIPVLDDQKHYFIDDEEVDKLLRFGAGWLESHPMRQEIVQRYLKRRRHLTQAAFDRLVPEEINDSELDSQQTKPSLHSQRLETVLLALQASGAKRVLDLGCGEGKLLRLLLADKQFSEILGVDVSHRALQIAAKRLKLEDMPERQRARIRLLQGSLTYRDSRLAGFEAAALVEVIEHLDLARLQALERVVFEFAKPKTVIVTTPNAEFNATWDSLPAGQFRHTDHRFEWTRLEFQTWAEAVAARFGYTVRLTAIGKEDATLGAPTQMGIFEVLL